ncbi:hypothetical protein PIB30_031365 [Stylosanthes scabra]|uniref:Uncharacterized protein n=1 Tax=Stylosanthes scabra TaxID=79078 RepID=A0ABU6WBJ6_9FABA|nr:hypothetical protein [Stylosanthes scabra]
MQGARDHLGEIQARREGARMRPWSTARAKSLWNEGKPGEAILEVCTQRWEGYLRQHNFIMIFLTHSETFVAFLIEKRFVSVFILANYLCGMNSTYISFSSFFLFLF